MLNKKVYDDFLFPPPRATSSESMAANFSKEQLLHLVGKLEAQLKVEKAQSKAWLTQYKKLEALLEQYDDELEKARKNIKQNDIRVTINRVFRLHKLRRLDIPRNAQKTVFLSQLSNFLNKQLSSLLNKETNEYQDQ